MAEALSFDTQPPRAAGPVHDSHASGVSWPAVFGGAIVTAAISLILLSLGAGLGLSAISPWSGLGASHAVIGGGVVIWLILMQVMSGSLGGYLAGRLRSRWPTIHTDEVYFRDTAHGFLSWGLAVVLTAAFLASAAAAMVGNSKSSGGMSEGTRTSEANAYYVDMLLRAPAGASDSNGTVVRGELGRIFDKGLAMGELPATDRSYLSGVIAARAGVSAAEADRRVGDTFAAAQQAIDTVRRATAHSLLWIFAALLAGAFFSSLAATIGGRQRDHVVVI
jgi:hypothetical protein